jgi:hypothetical protein
VVIKIKLLVMLAVLQEFIDSGLPVGYYGSA